MATTNLKYGTERIEFEYDAERFDVLGGKLDLPPLTDVEISLRLDHPIDLVALEETVEPGESVLIVVPDATRQTASGQIVNLLVRRLIAAGTSPSDIRIIFATGIHRLATVEEKREIVTPFVFQRLKTLDHNPRDLVQIRKLPATRRGTPVELNRALFEHNRVILVGAVSFHYFAGFGGGRKLVCPGLASARTVNETHQLAFDFERLTKHQGVGVGLLAGNQVHEEFVEIVERVSPAFAVNTIVDDAGRAVEIFAGDWRTSHVKACEFYARTHSIPIKSKRDLVIASAGGAPFDINLIQAHKALEMAAHACHDGGTIVLLAECTDGFGRNDFLNWFAAEDSGALARRLRENFQTNGQTAWSLLVKAERFRVVFVSNLRDDAVHQTRMTPASNLAEALSLIESNAPGYILPAGARFLPQTA